MSPPPGPVGPPEVGASVPDLLARIRILERRLNELDGKNKGAAVRGQDRSAKGAMPDLPPSRNATTNQAAGSETKPAPPAAPGADDTQSTTQGSFVFRDSAPTLNSRKFEYSIDANYTRNVGQTQFDRLALASVTARYGLGYGFEGAVLLPYYMGQRTTVIGIVGQEVNETVQSIGDVQVQLSRQLWGQGAGYPGASLMVGMVAPTGKYPYKAFGLTRGSNEQADPRSPFSPLMASRGHWAAISNLQFFKTFDPVIVFFGLGTDYAFEREIDGHDAQPGLRLTYNAGFSLALSEYTTLGAQYLGSLEKPLKVDGQTVASLTSSTLFEGARARFLVVQRLGEGIYLEPSLVLGLTNDIPSYTAGLTFRRRM